MEETAGPPQPILIQAGEGDEPETVAGPKRTVNTLESTEPSDASFVAFCRLCERLLATLEPAGKGHFRNRETAVLVKKSTQRPDVVDLSTTKAVCFGREQTTRRPFCRGGR